MRNIAVLGMAVGAWFGAQTTAQATVRIDIDLTMQRMHVTSGSGAQYEWAISSGRPGHATPVGYFRPQRMYVMVHSLKYDNAPMPHSIFFYGGYAIHGTDAVWHLGHVASHGCVRLAPQNAAALFEMVQHEGATIHIGGSAMANNAHKAGHRLAAMQRKRFHEHALAYAPHRRTRTLREWVRNPLADD